MSYTFDPKEDASTRNRRRRWAQMLLEKGSDTSPIASPWQGAARMAQAALGGWYEGVEDKREREQRDADNALNASALKLFSGGSMPSVSTAPGSAVTAALGSRTAEAPPELVPYFEEASKATGIPVPVLMAKAKQESSFNPNAVGRAGEIGLTQIMPSTARDPGFGLKGVDPATLRDPRANIMFGAQYLAGRGKAAGVTDWNNPSAVAKALTAYNGGGDPNYAQNVMRFLPKGFGAQPTQIAQAQSQDVMPGGPTTVTDTVQPGGMMGLGTGRQPWTPQQMQQAQQLLLNPRLAAPVRAMLMKQMEQNDPQAVARRALDDQKRALEIQDLERRSRQSNDPASVQEYNFAKSQGFQGSFTDWKEKNKNSTTVNTNVNANPGPTAKVFDTVASRAEAAQAAAAAMPAFTEAKRLVDSGNITLGAGADLKVAMQKVGAVFGMDATAASNAETFRSAMAPVVLSLVKGLGAGSGISNADREFAEKAAGGSISLEPATIKRMIEIGVKAAEFKMKDHQRMLDEVYPDTPENKQVRSLFRVNVPEAPPAPPAPEPAPSPPPAAATGKPVPVKTPDEARKLPSGTPIILPDGRIGKVP